MKTQTKTFVDLVVGAAAASAFAIEPTAAKST